MLFYGRILTIALASASLLSGCLFWEPHPCGGYPGRLSMAVCMPEPVSSSIFALGPGGKQTILGIFHAGLPRAVVYSSFDSGSSWSELEVSNPALLKDLGPLSLRHRSNGELELIAVSGYPRGVEKFKSSDGGVTWIAQGSLQLPSDVWPGSSDLKWVDEQNGYFTDSTYYDALRIYRTVDGGSSWQQLASLAGRGYSTQVAANSAGLVLVLGWSDDKVLLRRSADSGLTWTTREPLGNVRVEYPSVGQIALQADGTAIMVVETADPTTYKSEFEIYRSTDAGMSWAYLTSLANSYPKNSSVAGLHFDSLGNLFLHRSRHKPLIAGEVEVSPNSGLTWLGHFDYYDVESERLTPESSCNDTPNYYACD